VEQHLPQQEFQGTSPSEEASIQPNNDTLKVATVVQQIMTEHSETVSEKRQNNGYYKNCT
jgi:hypothetical protein